MESRWLLPTHRRTSGPLRHCQCAKVAACLVVHTASFMCACIPVWLASAVRGASERPPQRPFRGYCAVISESLVDRGSAAARRGRLGPRAPRPARARRIRRCYSRTGGDATEWPRGFTGCPARRGSHAHSSRGLVPGPGPQAHATILRGQRSRAAGASRCPCDPGRARGSAEACDQQRGQWHHHDALALCESTVHSPTSRFKFRPERSLLGSWAVRGRALRFENHKV